MRMAAACLVFWLRGKPVHMMLKDGTYLRGKVTDGNEAAVVVALKESSDGSEKSERTVSVHEVGTVIVREKIGGSIAAAGVAGGLLGFCGGVVAGAVSGNGNDPGPRVLLGAGLGLLVGTTASILGTDHFNWREITLIVE